MRVYVTEPDNTTTSQVWLTALGTFRVALRVGYIPRTSYTDIIYLLKGESSSAIHGINYPPFEQPGACLACYGKY